MSNIVCLAELLRMLIIQSNLDKCQFLFSRFKESSVAKCVNGINKMVDYDLSFLIIDVLPLVLIDVLNTIKYICFPMRVNYIEQSGCNCRNDN